MRDQISEIFEISAPGCDGVASWLSARDDEHRPATSADVTLTGSHGPTDDEHTYGCCAGYEPTGTYEYTASTNAVYAAGSDGTTTGLYAGLFLLANMVLQFLFYLFVPLHITFP